MLTSYEFLPDLQHDTPDGRVAIRATTSIEGQDAICTVEIIPEDMKIKDVLKIIRGVHGHNVSKMLQERGEL